MDETRGKIAWEIHNKIVKNEEQRRTLMARNAMFLSEIFDRDYYKELLGDEQAKWAGYLGELNVFYSRSKIFNLVAVYKKFTDKLKISAEQWVQIPTSRLVDMLPFVTEQNCEEWFSKALTLTSRDWQIESRRARGLITSEDEHTHQMVGYNICKVCGLKECTHDVVETPTEDFIKARPTFFKKPKTK